MSRVFLGNFDFEHELARAAFASAPATPAADAVARRALQESVGAERFWSWLPIAEVDDCLIAPGKIDMRDFDGLVELGLPVPRRVIQTSDFDSLRGAELIPWGWTSSIAGLARSYGWKSQVPPLAVVREVNSRAFRFSLERQWEVGLAGAAVINSIDELEQSVQQQDNSPRGWLLKANFGMSGREALRGRGTRLDDNLRNWAQKRFATGPIVFEPMVERIAEAGIQFEIPQSAPPRLVGVTPLLVDRSGVYRGSRFGCSETELAVWQSAVDVGLRVAQTVQQLGYFGPLGIDAMQFRDAKGTIRMRALQDLNARYTMGRVALGFRRILPSGWCGTWLHFSRRHLTGRELDSGLDELRQPLRDNVLIAVTSPREIGSQPVEHHALVVLAATSESRRPAEMAILGNLGIDIEVG